MKTCIQWISMVLISVLLSACGSGGGVGSNSGSGPAPVPMPSPHLRPTVLQQLTVQDWIQVDHCFESSKSEDDIQSSAVLMNCVSAVHPLDLSRVDARFDRSFLFIYRNLAARLGVPMDHAAAVRLMVELAGFEQLG